MEERFELENRDGLSVVGLVSTPNEPQGLAFIAHGLGGFKEQKHILAVKEVFLANGYTVVSYDAIHSVGESDGNIDSVTMTSYLHDLEDVINWARSKEFYQEPFVLCGHSMGGMIVTLFAEMHPEIVQGLIPLSPVVSGKLWLESTEEELLKSWKEQGYYEKESSSKPGVIKKIPWNLMEDTQQYDLTTSASVLTMPVLIVYGSIEPFRTRNQQDATFFDAIPKGKKKLHLIEGAGHNYYEPHELKELKSIIDTWIKSEL